MRTRVVLACIIVLLCVSGVTAGDDPHTVVLHMTTNDSTYNTSLEIRVVVAGTTYALHAGDKVTVGPTIQPFLEGTSLEAKYWWIGAGTRGEMCSGSIPLNDGATGTACYNGPAQQNLMYSVKRTGGPSFYNRTWEITVTGYHGV